MSAVDELDLELCDGEVFLNGEAVALLQGKPKEIEHWVKLVAEEANARLDWQATGYVAQMLHLGDKDSRIRVEVVLDELSSRMGKVVLKRLALNDPGIYRRSQRKILEGIKR